MYTKRINVLAQYNFGNGTNKSAFAQRCCLLCVKCRLGGFLFPFYIGGGINNVSHSMWNLLPCFSTFFVLMKFNTEVA